jgi:hypothetical protein
VRPGPEQRAAVSGTVVDPTLTPGTVVAVAVVSTRGELVSGADADSDEDEGTFDRASDAPEVGIVGVADDMSGAAGSTVAGTTVPPWFASRPHPTETTRVAAARSAAGLVIGLERRARARFGLMYFPSRALYSAWLVP